MPLEVLGWELDLLKAALGTLTTNKDTRPTKGSRAMPKSPENRTKWVGYLRVSTPEQAERDLSLPAQHRAVEAYAARNGRTLSRVYVEEGGSGTHKVSASSGQRTLVAALGELLRVVGWLAEVRTFPAERSTSDGTDAMVHLDLEKGRGMDLQVHVRKDLRPGAFPTWAEHRP